MGKMKYVLVLGTLILTIGVSGALRSLTTETTHAGVGIEVPGTLAALPQANGVAYEGSLSALDQHVTIRQALDAAEREFNLTDAQVDANARVVPAIVSVGLAPQEQHMKVLVVTTDVDLLSAGRLNTPATVTHKMCILVDAATGKYIMAYAAGPRDVLPH